MDGRNTGAKKTFTEMKFSFFNVTNRMPPNPQFHPRLYSINRFLLWNKFLMEKG